MAHRLHPTGLLMQKNNATDDIISLLRQRLPEMPIIILSKPLEPSSSVLDIQDYVMGGETIIPLFSSDEAFQASTRGTDLGRPRIEIARSLLAEISKGNEIYLLDPQLNGQLRFSAAELKLAFPDRLRHK